MINKKEIALELRAAFITVSPFIEKHTGVICPECSNVCCADRHGRHDRDDLIFLSALGITITDHGLNRRDSDACRYITACGCNLERWMRPFRCTFFFCDPLLKSLERDNSKLYRAFMDYFQHLTMLRQKLLECGE